jgi:catechol 2,3-dioxygenase-like lactoylglutathione lyase family enzyme
MAIKKIDHLYAQTSHWEKSISFWTALGFSVARQWGDAGHRACTLTCGDASVTLAELDDKSHLPDRATPYFLVDGIEQLSESVTQSKDVAVVLPLEKTHWGTRWIPVQDPDGNIYCLQERP